MPIWNGWPPTGKSGYSGPTGITGTVGTLNTNTYTVSTTSSGGGGGAGGGSTTVSSVGTSSNITTAGTLSAGGGLISQTNMSIVTFFNKDRKEIVRLDPDGSVTWNREEELDVAAETFSKLLVLSAEMRADITGSVKRNMRDSVFEDLIEIAKEKGPLSADELTYLLKASKIVEKLKGVKE